MGQNISHLLFWLWGEKGHEECLQLLLANSPSVVLVKDAMGNNILHASCNLQVPLSTFQLVVDVVSSAALSKAALSRNALGETPLHIACKHGRIALVDAFLSSLNFSLLAKVLVVQDQQAQTPFLAAVGSGSADVVMGLLMWRGNNHESISSKNAKCPLAWAVRTRNVDTVLLLLVTNHISSGDSNKTRRHNISVLCRSDSVNDVAKIRMPNDEELRSFRESIKSKYPSLKRVWGSMDGLKLLLERAGDCDTQNMFYNGWTHDHYVSCLFLFSPDGLVRACYLNAPGCWHDSTNALNSKIYDKVDDVYQRTRCKVVVDSAFSATKRPSLIKSHQTNFDRLGNTRQKDQIHRDATSVRQLSEWGMRGFQGSFPRLNDRMIYEENGEIYRLKRF
jgi:ankyrin repeat protein